MLSRAVRGTQGFSKSRKTLSLEKPLQLFSMYKARTLIPGHRVDPHYTGLVLIAIPKKLLQDNPSVTILYKEQIMIVNVENKILYEQDFEDKYDNGKYTLVYYQFLPTEQLKLI